MKKITFILFSVLFITACSNSNNKTSEQQSVIAQPDDQAQSQTTNMNNHPGKKVYDAVCLACHMRNGSGVPGMHPPITNSEFVNGDTEALITIVLNGLDGEMEIQGEIYDNIMPPQAHLSDKEVADVLTYVRGSFGNNSDQVTPDQVANVRAAIQ